MLYMEDYIEMIEHLPQELKDRFTEIRELDLQVQNATDKLEEKMKDFFGNARKLRISERDDVYEALKKEYYRVLEDADEKVHQANQMYDLVERYIRRLDQDLYKFKMELEADNAGITEILEKRSLELDQIGNKDCKDKDSQNSQKENRLLPSTPLTGIKVEKRGRKRLINGKLKGSESGACTPTTSYNGDHLDFAANSLVAALAQSISAQKGRPSNGVNGQSYDPYGDSDSSLLALDMTDALNSAELKRKKTDLLTNGNDDVNGVKRNKRKSQHIKPGKFGEENDAENSTEDLENGNSDQPEIWPYDPTEPRYCLCNQVSYGNMVACDNESCEIEWFHYGCVGITTSPKGKWYCPKCATTVKRRGRKTLNPQT